MTMATVLANAIQTDVFDWLEPANKNKPEVVFNSDPLAIVVEFYDRAMQPWEMYEQLTSKNTLPTLSAKSLATADTIRKYFKNKILMRRLKNEHVSEFMIDTEALLESSSVRQDRLNILVKLPMFYHESIVTEGLLKDHNSLESDRGLYNSEEVWSFVKRIDRFSRNQKTQNFYYKNKNNNLLRVSVPYKDMGSSIWDYISKKKEIGIKAPLPKVRLQGYDYFVYGLGNNYELFDPR